MIHCTRCTTVLMERTLCESKLLLCPMCGNIYEKIKDNHYRYIGTTQGNRNMKELLPITDEATQQEEQNNETMALETTTTT